MLKIRQRLPSTKINYLLAAFQIPCKFFLVLPQFDQTRCKTLSQSRPFRGLFSSVSRNSVHYKLTKIIKFETHRVKIDRLHTTVNVFIQIAVESRDDISKALKFLMKLRYGKKTKC